MRRWGPHKNAAAIGINNCGTVRHSIILTYFSASPPRCPPHSQSLVTTCRTIGRRCGSGKVPIPQMVSSCLAHLPFVNAARHHHDPEILGSKPRAGGRWVSIRRQNVSRFHLRIDSALEVKCCARNHIYVSSQGHQILASANAATKVSRSYGYLSSKVE